MVTILLAATLSAQLPPVTFDRCHDAAFYAGAAAEAHEAGTPWIEVFERDARAAESYNDLLLRLEGLRLGYSGLQPDEAARLTFEKCLKDPS